MPSEEAPIAWVHGLFAQTICASAPRLVIECVVELDLRVGDVDTDGVREVMVPDVTEGHALLACPLAAVGVEVDLLNVADPNVVASP